MTNIIIKSTELKDTFLSVSFRLNGNDFQTGVNIASLIRFAVMIPNKEYGSYKPQELANSCVNDMELIERYMEHLRSGNKLRYMLQENWDLMMSNIDDELINLGLIERLSGKEVQY